MKVNATANLIVELDNSEQKKVVDALLLRIFDIPSEQCYIEKGKLMMWWVDGGGSHSWTETKVVRKATDSDKIYFEFIKMFKEKYAIEERYFDEH